MRERAIAESGAWLKPGTLPSGWVWATLGEICLPISKHDPRDRRSETFTYIDIGGIDGHRIAETKAILGSEAPS